MSVNKNIKINSSNLIREYDAGIFKVDEYHPDSFSTYKEIAQKLKNKKPYTITVIIDNLDPKFWNNKKYVKKTRIPIQSRYRKLLYEYFFIEFDNRAGNELYAKWLDKYRSIWKKEQMKKDLDDYIIENELEPRYKDKILKKYKNHEKLFAPRTEVKRDRYYNLPQPLNRVDWRNPYDNIFVWEKNGKKVLRKGGSGSSGGRETNSKFILGLSLMNKIKPIKSFLFLYSSDNKLYFIKEFSSLTVPGYDIGCNYHLKSSEVEKIISETNLIRWKDFNELTEVNVTLNKLNVKI